MSPALLAQSGIFCVATNAALQLKKCFLAASIELQARETYASSDATRYFTIQIPLSANESRPANIPSVTTLRALEGKLCKQLRVADVERSALVQMKFFNEVRRKATVKHISLSVSSRQRRLRDSS
jgi:hypothetical protein